MSIERNFNRMKNAELRAVTTEALNTAEKIQATFKASEQQIVDINTEHQNIAQHQQLVTNLEDINNSFDYNTTKTQLANIAKMHGDLEIFYNKVFDPKTGLNAEFEALKTTINDHVTNANNARIKITGEGEVIGYEKEAKAACSETKSFFENAKTYLAELLEDKEGDPSIKTTIAKSKEAVESMESEVQEFYNALLIDKEGEGNSKISLKTQIKDYRAALKDLTAKMYGLLPKYVSATQAYSYYDAKSYHGPTKSPPAENSKEQTWYHKAFITILDLSRYMKPVFFYSVFIGPIIVLIAIFTPVFLGISIFDLFNNEPIKIPEGTNSNYWFGVIFRIVVAAPLGFISLFGYKSIARSRKLYEEYDHKQRVMETYFGFKKEAETLSKLDGNNLAHINKLMSIVLTTVADKPSSIKTPDDEDIDSIIPNTAANDMGENNKATPKPKATPRASKEAKADG